MQAQFENTAAAPIYLKIVEKFTRDIRSGILAAGHKLPTVRALAMETGASQGTVKHAYDELERLGLIEKAQGKGSFVRDWNEGKSQGKKEQALTAIDGLLDEMSRLGFSMWDTRIFLDLKMREREQLVDNVRIGAVDCSVEAISVMYDQILELPHVDAYEFLLQPILDAPGPFDPGLDILITTPAHFEELALKLPSKSNLIRMVMAISGNTLLELARIPPEATVGIICLSERFANIVARACEQYCILKKTPEIAYFGNYKAVRALALKSDRLIFPPNYMRFASAGERDVLSDHERKSSPVIYRYQIERGSLLYLEEEVVRIYQNNLLTRKNR